MGWSKGPFGLIARFPGFPNVALTDLSLSPGTRTFLFLIPAPEPSWVNAEWQPGRVFGDTFPYGFAVEAD